ncbi:MAG: hypothetical protein PVJ09_03350 [Candidatus Woesebacteria bacterium]|jgi:hypothetical protein
MPNLNTAGVSADVRNRLLNFLNNASNANSIAGSEPVHGPILDDPSTGYGDNVEDYDIGQTVARRIIQKRNSLAGDQFTTLNQLNNIAHFGQDKFNDLVHTFSRYWELFFALTLYGQTTGFYCGAATAQMILDFLHGWAGTPALTQDEIYDIIQNHKTDNSFYTDPDGLRGCLNQESPAVNRWIIFAGRDNEQDKACRKIATSMDLYDSPAAALIYDGDHWVAVSGLTATERPSMNKKSFLIYTIQIHDPAGGGNVRDIEYYNWCSNFFTPNTWGTTWDDRYVCVVDPRPQGGAKIDFVQPNYKAKGRTMITPNQAKQAAQESLDDYHLTSRDDYQKALRKAKVGTPVLVKNLREKRKRAYYLIPFERGQKTTVVLMIHAYYGNYLGSSLVDQPKGYLNVSQSRAKNLAADHIKKTKVTRGRSLTKLKAKDIEKAYLVWKPSQQSWDPFQPIWKLKAKGRVRYVNQDKEISSRLKRAKKGGM